MTSILRRSVAVVAVLLWAGAVQAGTVTINFDPPGSAGTPPPGVASQTAFDEGSPPTSFFNPGLPDSPMPLTPATSLVSVTTVLSGGLASTATFQYARW